MAAFGDENVGGLDVEVDESLGVGGVEGIGDLGCQNEQGVEFDGLAGDAVLQGRAIEVLHGDEGAAVVLSDVVNGADVGMIERGGGLGFALKTGEPLGIAGDIFGQEFQGDKAMEAGVFGFVNHAHASAAEFLEDAVVRDGLVDHRRTGVGVALSYGWGSRPSANAGRWSVPIEFVIAAGSDSGAEVLARLTSASCAASGTGESPVPHPHIRPHTSGGVAGSGSGGGARRLANSPSTRHHGHSGFALCQLRSSPLGQRRPAGWVKLLSDLADGRSQIPHLM